MSDCHIVKKKKKLILFFKNIGHLFYLMLLRLSFNKREVTKNVSNINELFCGSHFPTYLDDQTEVALKGWDKLLYENKPVGSLCSGGYSKGYSDVYHTIQSIYKSVQTHGSEKFGRISEFYSFLTEEYGFSSISFITFEGNRFNGLFYNGGVFFCLYEQLKEFFKVFKGSTKLLKWTYYDLHVKSFMWL